MEKFTILKGKAAPLLRTNVDTGAMIDSRFTRDINSHKDMGGKFFYDWRFDAEGKEIPDFILNQPRFRNAEILVACENFGCGSSRERAVWAMRQYGIRTVIAPSYGEIFQENCYQNGVPPIQLSKEQVEQIGEALLKSNNPELTVDLENCVVKLEDGTSFSFKVPEERRVAMVEGLDELGQLLRYDQQFDEFQKKDREKRPWIYAQ